MLKLGIKRIDGYLLYLPSLAFGLLNRGQEIDFLLGFFAVTIKFFDNN